MGDRVKAPQQKQKQKPGKAGGEKKPALRPAKPERSGPAVRYGQELNDRNTDDERAFMDW